MIIDNAKIIKCPFCGAKKELLSLRSGNTFWPALWSDGKQITPMLPQLSPVQKCPDCGKYYILHKQKAERGNAPSFETGNLSYEEWKEAYEQFHNTPKLNWKDKYIIRISVIQAFNDRFNRGPAPLIYIEQTIPPQEDYTFFVSVIKEFIHGLKSTDPLDMILKAELYREAGLFEQSEITLHSVDPSQMDEFTTSVYNTVLTKLQAKDLKVFRVI